MNSATKTQNTTRQKLSILIADDDQDTVTTLAEILMDEGHVVHTVTHGGLVPDAITRFKPQVCILDIQMPGRDGYGLARDISERQKGAVPLLIAISGKWTTQTDRMVASMVGFKHFFPKPADPNELIRVLNEFEPKDAA